MGNTSVNPHLYIYVVFGLVPPPRPPPVQAYVAQQPYMEIPAEYFLEIEHDNWGENILAEEEVRLMLGKYLQFYFHPFQK